MPVKSSILIFVVVLLFGAACSPVQIEPAGTLPATRTPEVIPANINPTASAPAGNPTLQPAQNEEFLMFSIMPAEVDLESLLDAETMLLVREFGSNRVGLIDQSGMFSPLLEKSEYRELSFFALNPARNAFLFRGSKGERVPNTIAVYNLWMLSLLDNTKSVIFSNLVGAQDVIWTPDNEIEIWDSHNDSECPIRIGYVNPETQTLIADEGFLLLETWPNCDLPPIYSPSGQYQVIRQHWYIYDFKTDQKSYIMDWEEAASFYWRSSINWISESALAVVAPIWRDRAVYYDFNLSVDEAKNPEFPLKSFVFPSKISKSTEAIVFVDIETQRFGLDLYVQDAEFPYFYIVDTLNNTVTEYPFSRYALDGIEGSSWVLALELPDGLLGWTLNNEQGHPLLTVLFSPADGTYAKLPNYGLIDWVHAP